MLKPWRKITPAPKNPIPVTTPAAITEQLTSEMKRMAECAKETLELAGNGFIEVTLENKERILHNVEVVNWLSENLTEFFIRIHAMELQGIDSERTAKIFYVVNDIKRISDHAENLLEKTEIAVDKGIEFSEDGKLDLRLILKHDLVLFEKAIEIFENRSLSEEEENELRDIEDAINTLTTIAQEAHVQRLREGRCGVRTGTIYIQSLTDFERCGDHAFNIALEANLDETVLKAI